MVKNRPTCATLASKSFKYSGSKFPYIWEAIFASTIATRNKIKIGLSRGADVVFGVSSIFFTLWF
jgi:hypothetical protein